MGLGTSSEQEAPIASEDAGIKRYAETNNIIVIDSGELLGSLPSFSRIMNSCKWSYLSITY